MGRGLQPTQAEAGQVQTTDRFGEAQASEVREALSVDAPKVAGAVVLILEQKVSSHHPKATPESVPQEAKTTPQNQTKNK